MKANILLAFVVVAAISLFASEEKRAKKVIGCGWGFNTAKVEDFLACAEQFDKTGLDGVTVWLRGRDKNGKAVGYRHIYTEDWSYDMFAPMVPKLKAMSKHKAFKENFLMTFRSPRKRYSWSDDALWKRIAENMRVAARIAKEGGCRGLLMDCEDYCYVGQFSRKHGDLPVEEQRAQVRRRAFEIFNGVFEEFPEAVVMSYWFLSWGNNKCPYPRKVALSAKSGASLWPAFVDGILDALPPKAKLVDGNEYAYGFDADNNDFYRAAYNMRYTLLPLVAEENREKYSRQMQVGFGLYLDMFVNKEGVRWYFPPKDGSRTETFRRNLEQAFEVADEYVWIYGERLEYVRWPKGFKHNPGTRPDTWEENIPGLGNAIRSVKDIDGFARERRLELVRQGAWTNLVKNGDCSLGKPGSVPKPFGSWQPGKEETHTGSFGCDTTFGKGDKVSLCAEGVSSGCFVYLHKDMKPGEIYLVGCSSSGKASTASIAWKGADGKYLRQGLLNIPFADEVDGWRDCEIALRVPPGAATLQLTMNVSLAPGEKTWFDDVAVYPILRR